MNVIESETGDGVVVALSKEELLILNNALNEVCNALDIREFQTRMGANREEVLALLRQVNRLLT
jgi:hypothetical protein